ncbi:MAG: porin OmpA [Sodalis sp. (in: enterobacteria)]
MKKISFLLSVLVLNFVTVAQAATKDDIWYTGVKLGWSCYHDASFYGFTPGFDSRTIGNGPTHKNQVGAGAFVGYQTNSHLSFEAGYDWLGRVPYKGSIDNGAIKAQGLVLAAKLSRPLINDLDLYTRFGGIIWRFDSKGSYNNGSDTRMINHDTGVSAIASIGLEYTYNKNWTARFDYQWSNNLGDKLFLGSCPDNALLNFVASYHFGQDEVVNAPQPASASIPVQQTDCYTLQHEVLFDFNKVSMKGDWQKVLDQLYARLRLMNVLKDHSVIVLGYSDRIGTKEYNQQLSQDRAQSVVSYLISKGLPAEKISSTCGMGQSNSITGVTCNTLKSRAAVIHCLSPDRRVEIKVKK